MWGRLLALRDHAEAEDQKMHLSIPGHHQYGLTRLTGVVLSTRHYHQPRRMGTRLRDRERPSFGAGDVVPGGWVRSGRSSCIV